MTKTELMENYTPEQLAEMVLKLQEQIEVLQDIAMEKERKMTNNIISVIVGGFAKEYQIEEIGDIVRAYEENKMCQNSNNPTVSKLQYEIEKCRKAFSDTKKECDCRIHEYQDKIDEMRLEIESLSKDNISVHQEPIGIAKDLINAEGKFERRNPFEIALCGAEKTYRIFDVSELRQIAEHLMIYCDYSEKNEENEEI